MAKNTRDPLRTALTALAVVALLAVCWFGYSWWSAAADESVTTAREREAVIAATGDALVALHTVDYHAAAGDVDRWIAVTTGQFGKDLAGDRQLHLDRAQQTRSVATARLARAAVTELDADAGTARLLAILDLQVSTDDQPPAPNRARLDVNAQRTDQGWKVSAVQAG